MIAVFTVLLVVTVSLVVIRVATVGLTMTGVSRDIAQFQALSAFTGSGFTTRESEEIVNHPVRRRIVMHLMLLGNAGIVVAVASVLGLLLKTEVGDDYWYNRFWVRLAILTLGLAALWILALSSVVETVMWKVNTWAILRWTRLDLRDYTQLLHLARDYAVAELRIHQEDWVAGRTLADLQLSREGILVLGIETSDGHYLGTPHGTTRISPGDSLVVYGKHDALMRLDDRQAGFAGNADHMIAVTRQLEVEDEEDASD